jgi:hypothetical protein
MRFISLILVLLAAAVLTTTASAEPAGFTPVKLHAGMRSTSVAELQMFLRMNKRWNYLPYKGGYTGYFGSVTVTGLKGWQKAVGRKPTGFIVIGSSEWNQLKNEAMRFRLPAGIDPQAVGGARQDGWAADANKQTRMLYLLHYQRYQHKVVVALSTPTSFGGCNSDGCFVTPDGVFNVIWKDGPNHRSNEWFDPITHQGYIMPWPVFFHGGVAIHQDPLGSSHECIHVPYMGQAQYIHDHLPIGALVVVHG